MKKIVLAFFVILAVLVTGVSIGFYYGKTQSPPEGLDFSLFWEAWRTLEKHYVDPESIDYQEMVYGAISGMVESLQDPYTVFMKEEELKIFEEETEGRFDGIGIEFGIREDQLTVIAPLEGTPAKKAGLMAGDKIVKIDDKDAHKMSVDAAAALIRGAKGTEVKLTILREGWSEPKDFVIIRDTIRVPHLEVELLEGNIAHIRLYRFSSTVIGDFNDEANEIWKGSSEKIVLDLRNNPGGYLNVTQDIAGWFLENNAIVAIEETGPNKTGEVFKARGASQLLTYPTVVLINQGSASASEILAGALRDNRGIKLIGETTFGKGSIQELKYLKEGGMKITIAKWLTPAGHEINEIGLEPDIAIELTDEDFEAGTDPQLAKALEVLKEMR